MSKASKPKPQAPKASMAQVVRRDDGLLLLRIEGTLAKADFDAALASFKAAIPATARRFVVAQGNVLSHWVVDPAQRVALNRWVRWLNQTVAEQASRTAAATDTSSTSWAQVARDALASTSELTAIAPEALAKLLAYEARDAGVPLFHALVTVKEHARWWAELLDAIKGQVVAGG